MADKTPYDPLTEQFSFSTKVPVGDDHERLVCDTCGWVHYINPKIVVGSVCQWQDRILLCKRAIEPRKGFWTIPAGFLEERETLEQGAMREAREEANADITITALLAIYNVPHISQVQIMHVANLNNADVSIGPESEEVALVKWDEIPWNELAFPSVDWALNQYREVSEMESFMPFGNPEGPLATAFYERMKKL